MEYKDREARINAQLVDAIYRQAPGAMIATLINAAILAFFLRGEVPGRVLVVWLAATGVVLAARAALLSAYLKSAPQAANGRAWRRAFISGIFLSGALWGSSAVFLFPHNSPLHQALLIIVLCGMVAGAVGSFSVFFDAFYLFSLPALVPLFMRFLLMPGEIYRALAAMTLLFIVLTLMTARRACRENRERVELKEYFSGMLEERTAELSRANNLLRSEIEERRRAEEALAESETRYRDLFDNIPDLVYAHDLQGNMLETNRAWEKYGFDRGEMAGLNAREIMPEEVRKEFPAYLERVLKDGFVEGLMRIRLKEGDEIVAEYRNDLIRDAEGRPLVVRGAARDVTDRIQARKEKKALEVRLMQSQRLEAIGTLAGGIAHNFNNLLMGVQGNASLGKLEIDPSHVVYSRLEHIESLVDRGSDLTRHLLAYAREGKVQVRSVDVNEIVKSTAATMGETRKDIRVLLDLTGGLDPVEADVMQIRQALMILCVNASEAMPGGGELTLATRSVSADLVKKQRPSVRDCRYVKISVRDTGVGMDRRTMAKAFDPFFTTKEIGVGTGLGLASVHGTVESHGGLIEVNSEVGRGTCFDLYLPVAGGRKRKEQVLMEERKMTRLRTILVVDDEEIISEVAGQMLETLGFRVLRAGSGTTALDVYKRHRDEIDLVILDMIMPDMGGGETFDRLKLIDPGVRVLLSSGYSLDGEAREILDRGCSGFIQKPFRLSDLSGTIEEILGKAGRP